MTCMPYSIAIRGAYDWIALLRQHGIAVAISSMTWEFAVEWFARRLQSGYDVEGWSTRAVP